MKKKRIGGLFDAINIKHSFVLKGGNGLDILTRTIRRWIKIETTLKHFSVIKSIDRLMGSFVASLCCIICALLIDDLNPSGNESHFMVTT